MNGWTNPRLGVRFMFELDSLELYRPDGDRFLTFVELGQAKAQAEQRAEVAKQQLEQERQRAERLRALGIDSEAE